MDNRENIGADNTSQRGSALLGWIAIILAIGAIVIAWMAYNRTGEDLDNRIRSEVNQGLEAGQDTLQNGTQETTPAPQPTAPTPPTDGTETEETPQDTPTQNP